MTEDQREKAKAQYLLERKNRFRKALLIRLGIIAFAVAGYLCLRYFYL